MNLYLAKRPTAELPDHEPDDHTAGPGAQGEARRLFSMQGGESARKKPHVGGLFDSGGITLVIGIAGHGVTRVALPHFGISRPRNRRKSSLSRQQGWGDARHVSG